MTPRACLYLKIKKAHKLLSTEAGRQSLADRGLYPIRISFDVGYDNPYDHCYMIDKKGNIVGTSLPPFSKETSAILVLDYQNAENKLILKDIIALADDKKPIITDSKLRALEIPISNMMMADKYRRHFL